MLRLAIVAMSVGLADSLNPSTAGPALYLATVPKGVTRVVQFTAGVFTVNLAAGLLLTLGPGSLLVGLVPHPQGNVRHAIELGAGAILLAFAAVLWMGRRNLARRALPMRSGRGGSAMIAGASIAAIELPTAVPYFAVVVAVVASGASLPLKVGLVVLYNVAFVLPLLAIVLVILIAGARSDRWLNTGGAWLQRRWPVVVASVLLLLGGGLIVLGGIGLAKS
jgi:cytochrome c biogenesis protein CcdA